MESRTVFQMDQTALTDKSILWYIPECGIYPNMDSCQHIRLGCNYEEANKATSFSLHNSTDFKYYTFREDAHQASLSAARLTKTKQRCF